MSILSSIARNLLRQEMRDRAERKKRRFTIRNPHVGMELLCRGDWQDTHAPNFDLQLRSARLGLCLSVFGYQKEEVLRAGGPSWLFASQNRQVLRNRQNAREAERQKNWEDDEKIVFRAADLADHQNTTFLYDFCLVGFKKKGKYLWMMLNGLPDNVWEQRGLLDRMAEELVCLDKDMEDTERSGPSLAERVGRALGMDYQILPPQTTDKALVRIWKSAAQPGVQPLLLLPDEHFLDAQPMPEYPLPDTDGWPDAAAFLRQKLDEIKQSYDDSEEDREVWREITAESADREIRQGEGGLYVPWKEVQAAGGLLLLRVPAIHP